MVTADRDPVILGSRWGEPREEHWFAGVGGCRRHGSGHRVDALGGDRVGLGGDRAPVEGVTSDSVKVGFIYSKTGVASATWGDSDVGCKAHVARENAAGGVNGRKIDVSYADDQSSGANKTAAQDLVQNQHVYMVVNDSAIAYLSYRWLLDMASPSSVAASTASTTGHPGTRR